MRNRFPRRRTRQQPVGTVYLIHFSEPIGSARHRAQHYIGWAVDVEARLQEHLAGRGARILAYVAAAGITGEVARTWAGTRELERRLKASGHYQRHCPVCGGRSA